MHKRDGCKGNEIQAPNGTCKDIPLYDVLTDKTKTVPQQPQNFKISYRVDKGEWRYMNVTAITPQDAAKYFKNSVRPGLSGLKVEIKVDPADSSNVKTNVN